MPKDKSQKPWMDPRITTVIQAVLYWKGLAKCKKGGRVGKELLKRRGAKGGIPH